MDLHINVELGLINTIILINTLPSPPNLPILLSIRVQKDPLNRLNTLKLINTLLEWWFCRRKNAIVLNWKQKENERKKNGK